MAFHWEYEGKGENARCVHTWGDGGVMENFIRYGKGYTHIRNGEGAETEYHYGGGQAHLQDSGCQWGITRQQYNGYQELEVTVNPEGYTRKTSYNESGQPVRITDENGEDTFLSYDGNRNLVLLCTPGGKQLSWDYDGMDRVVSRTTLSGGDREIHLRGRRIAYHYRWAGTRLYPHLQRPLRPRTATVPQRPVPQVGIRR